MTNNYNSRKDITWECGNKYDINLGEDLKHYIAETITNNMCETPITGLETSTDNDVISFLKKSSFYRLKRESEYLLASQGVCVWGLIKNHAKENIMTVLNLQFASDKEVWGTIDDVSLIGGFNVSTSLWARYFFKGRIPYLQIYIIGIESEKVTSKDLLGLDKDDWESEYAFPEFKQLPCKVISNTFAYKSDISRVSEANYKLLNTLSNETINVWEFSKKMWLNSATNGGNFNSNSLNSKMKKGKRILDSNSMNADGTPPFAQFSNGDSAELILQSSIIGAIKDSILQLTFCMREVLSGSTNKHNLENVKIDENALSHLKNKLIIRENQYNEFFEQFTNLKVNVSMNLNEFSKFKFQSTDPTLVPEIQLKGVKIKAQNVIDAIETKADVEFEVLKRTANDPTIQKTVQVKATD